ncbi:hypothetical protein NEIRO03_0043 [Nematocida sp. AWRm78]|nr:hypothetical protein NEIRO02_0142 [Nematocida sp. AWRm79]KAI5182359.1 hypothetical protein NEIRO03_0043 [Nematocida sp. AWRm78]
MEGETYGSISRMSESGIFCRKSIEFIHGRRSEEGLFRVVIERRMTRTKYLVEDISGKGILNLESIPNEVVNRIIKKEGRENLQLQVIGKLQSDAPQEYPIIDATSVSIFSFEGALQHILYA